MDEHIEHLVRGHLGITEVWLIGSRADGSASEDSDWDYIIFADLATLDGLSGDPSLKRAGIDLLVVYDGDKFRSPWPDGDRVKQGSLTMWKWTKTSSRQATYRATKIGAPAKTAMARRVWAR